MVFIFIRYFVKVWMKWKWLYVCMMGYFNKIFSSFFKYILMIFLYCYYYFYSSYYCYWYYIVCVFFAILFSTLLIFLQTAAQHTKKCLEQNEKEAIEWNGYIYRIWKLYDTSIIVFEHSEENRIEKIFLWFNF